jgi:ATP-binding cassette subfamily B multidrug efflux pump
VQDGINTLALAHDVKDAPDAKPLKVAQGELRFEGVSFSYGGAAPRPVVDRLDLVIRPARRSAWSAAPARASRPSSTCCCVSTISRAAASPSMARTSPTSQDSLRAQIGMVTQDTSLLHRSVRENMIYGRPDASDAEMIHAAEQAEAHDFIGTLADARAAPATTPMSASAA